LEDRTALLRPEAAEYIRAHRPAEVDENQYVLRGKIEQQPAGRAWVSRRGRRMLALGGMGGLGLRELTAEYYLYIQAEGPGWRRARRGGDGTAGDPMRLWHLARNRANTQLHRLVEQGALVHIGRRYVPPERRSAPPEQWEQMIVDYLSTSGSAVRQDVA